MRFGVTLVAMLLISSSASTEAWAQQTMTTGVSKITGISGLDREIILHMEAVNKCGPNGAESSLYVLRTSNPNYRVLADLVLGSYVTLSGVSLSYRCRTPPEAGADIEAITVRR